METVEERVVDYFNTKHDNRISVIAKHFNIHISTASRIIDKYLKQKSP